MSTTDVYGVIDGNPIPLAEYERVTAGLPLSASEYEYAGWFDGWSEFAHDLAILFGFNIRQVNMRDWEDGLAQFHETIQADDGGLYVFRKAGSRASRSGGSGPSAKAPAKF